MKELTVKEYAALRGISTQAVYKAIAAGTVQSKKVPVTQEITVISVSDGEFDRLYNMKLNDTKQNYL